MTGGELTAAGAGLCPCPACGVVSRPDSRCGRIHCPRCFARLSGRKPDSTARCWAMVIAAAILYIPANLLPIMETGTLMQYRKDTIMSGILHLWSTGSWGVGAVVFIASIFVPLFKLLALGILLVSVRTGSRWSPMQRTRLYRLVDLVGRWSMLDIYVVTILASLVQIRSLAVIRASTGAVAFGAVVVLTMLATIAFDPRLLWDDPSNEADR